MQTKGRTGRALAACVLLVLAFSARADSELYAYEMPLTVTQDAFTADGLTLWAGANDVPGLRKRLEQTTVTAGKHVDGALQVTLSGTDLLRGSASGAHLASTFLVDFMDPATQTLVEEAGVPGEGEAAVRRLSDFVKAQMGPSPYSRGFDVASIVARDRVGDCTEHAILLTALARANAFPARTVLGALVIVGGARDGAFGHAWTEIWADGAWHLADATQPGKNYDGDVYYLPIGALSEEGMGYAMGLVELITVMPTGLYATAGAALDR